MKKYLMLSFLLGVLSVNAQEKVGIKTDEPTTKLDINGELRIRDLEKQENPDAFLTADEEGYIWSEEIPVDHVGIDAEEAKVYVPVTADASAIQPIIAELPVMTTTATIPANKHITLIVAYSLPIGEDYKVNKSQYFGVRFYKEMNGVKELVPEMTRKFTTTNNSNWNMISITNQYVKTFDVQPYDRKVTFSLEGFVDTRYDGGTTNLVKFQMYNNDTKANEPNYNWGNAYISYEVLEIKAGK